MNNNFRSSDHLRAYLEERSAYVTVRRAYDKMREASGSPAGAGAPKETAEHFQALTQYETNHGMFIMSEFEVKD